MVTDQPGALGERFFFEPQRSGAPRSWESRRAFPSFDLLAFTVSFEEQWVILIRMLKDAGIPPRYRDRYDAHPIVAVGGVAARLNPRSVLPFVDLVVPGDAECVLPAMLDVLRHGRGLPREKIFAPLDFP